MNGLLPSRKSGTSISSFPILTGCRDPVASGVCDVCDERARERCVPADVGSYKQTAASNMTGLVASTIRATFFASGRVRKFLVCEYVGEEQRPEVVVGDRTQQVMIF